MGEVKSKKRIMFQPSGKDAFFDTLKTRVNQYFESEGIDKYADGPMKWKVAILFGIIIGSWAILMTDPQNFAVMLLLYSTMTMATASVIFNIGHDAVHQTFSKKKWVNNWLFTTSFFMIGDNGNYWKARHVQSHHNYVNIKGYDVDVEIIWLLRFTRNTKYYWVHKFQWLYAPLLYLHYSLYWVTFSDFKILLNRTHLGFIKINRPIREFVIYLCAKTFYYGYAIVLPIMFLDVPWWWVVSAFYLGHLASSVYILGMLIATHLFDEASWAQPSPEGRLPYNWSIHHVENCLDYAIDSRSINWVIGGENTHAIHHLFPRIAHCHYPPLTHILKETCAEFGVNYHQLTWWGGIKSHYRLLKRMSDPSTYDRPEPVRRKAYSAVA